MTKLLQNIRIARVSTVPSFVLTQLRTQLQAINNAGATVTVITSNEEGSDTIRQLDYCHYKPVYIAREIEWKADLRTLFQLIKLFKSEKFDIVHSTTPKAGLLCAIAARLSKIPIRLHTYTGQRWVTLSGIKKFIVKSCDRLIGFLNTHSYADSPSQLDFLVASRVVRQTKINVLGSGSIGGVNLSRFNPENFSDQDRKKIRDSYGIKDDDFVLLFVGRITKDKGIFELVEAFHQLESDRGMILLIAGSFEQEIEQEIRDLSRRLCGDRIIFTGFCPEPESCMPIADILCLPSYREGFGSVIIEAAAMGVPAVGTRIYGLTDAVVEGVTGSLVETKNVPELKKAIQQLVTDRDLRLVFGKNARARAVNEFDSNKCGELWVSEYEKLLGSKKQHVTG